MTTEEKIDQITKELLDSGGTSASRVGEHISELLAYDTAPEEILICAVDLEEMAEIATRTAARLRQIILEEAIK